MSEPQTKVDPRKHAAAELLREAAHELVRLREQYREAAEYRLHTERLLALFEGGPQRCDTMGFGEDIAWRMQTMADSLEGKNEVDPGQGTTAVDDV